MREGKRSTGNAGSGGYRSSVVGWVTLAAVFSLLLGTLLVITEVEPRFLSGSLFIVSTVDSGVQLVIIAAAVLAVILMKMRKRQPVSATGGKPFKTGSALFDDRLRRVETLYRDDVLSEGEYKRKRREILDGK